MGPTLVDNSRIDLGNLYNNNGDLQHNDLNITLTDNKVLLESDNEYEYLIHISPELKKRLACMSLAVIYSELGYKSLEITNAGKKLTLETRRQLEDEIQLKLESHLETYSKTMQNVALPAFEGFCAIVTGVSGGLLSGLSQAFTFASQGVGRQLENYHQVEIKGFEHLNQAQQRLIQEYVSSRQQLAQNDDRWREISRNAAQDLHELFKQLTHLG